MAFNKQAVQKAADDKRGRNWTIILYPEDLPVNWEIKLQSLKVKIILSPCHDKDLKEDGTTKKKHYHAILMFSNKKSATQVIGLLKSVFGAADNSIQGVATVLAEQCLVHDIYAAVRYLAHIDNPDKAQYSANEIKGLNGADVMGKLKMTETETQDTVLAIQNFVADNDITEFCDLVDMASSNREWYRIVTGKYAMFFKSYVQSRRYKYRQSAE